MRGHGKKTNGEERKQTMEMLETIEAMEAMAQSRAKAGLRGLQNNDPKLRLEGESPPPSQSPSPPSLVEKVAFPTLVVVGGSMMVTRGWVWSGSVSFIFGLFMLVASLLLDDDGDYLIHDISDDAGKDVGEDAWMQHAAMSAGQDDASVLDMRREMKLSQLQQPSQFIEQLEKLQDDQLESADADKIASTDVTNEATDATHARSNTMKCLAIMHELSARVADSIRNNHGSMPQMEDGLALVAQEACCSSIRKYPEDVNVIRTALFLLSLIAKNTAVRTRCISNPRQFGVKGIIQSMRRLLDKARNERDESQEEILAESLRKGALLLGVLADDDGDGSGDRSLATTLSRHVCEAGGMGVIIDTANWYRLHRGIVKWSLWSIFTLCYDNAQHKAILIQFGGVGMICRSLHNFPECLDIHRHGLGILFDILRETAPGQNQNGDIKIDYWKVRNHAVNCGLHVTAQKAMKSFPRCPDILMMAQQLLLGTGYAGEIPSATYNGSQTSTTLCLAPS